MAEIKILNPKGTNLPDIHHDIQMQNDEIIDVMTYPNGFIMKTITRAGEVTVETSAPLIKIDECTYQIPE